MSDYTPAPWKLEHLGEWWVAYGPGRVIFQVGAVDEIDEANARLIERAPEMDARIRELEAALRDCVSHFALHSRSDYPTRTCTDCSTIYHTVPFGLLHPKGDA